MIIRKRAFADVPREGAHDGAGGRRFYVRPEDIASSDWQAMTYGYLPAGSTFDWHNHEKIEEIMLVIKGTGVVSDRDGDYEYEAGDLFVFPADQDHKIHNPSSEEHEYVFVRINARP